MSEVKQTEFKLIVVFSDGDAFTLFIDDSTKAEEQAAYIAVNGFRYRDAFGSVNFYPVHRIHKVIVEEVMKRVV